MNHEETVRKVLSSRNAAGALKSREKSLHYYQSSNRKNDGFFRRYKNEDNGCVREMLLHLPQVLRQ